VTKRGRTYNRIYTDADWQQVNQENKDIMQDFIEEYKQRKMKESTIKQYQNDLRIVLIYILKKRNNKTITDLKKKDFRSFSIWLSDELKVSNARTNRLMSAVRSMLTYVEDDDEYDYDNNIAKKVHGLPKDPVRTNEDDFFLSFEQVMKLRKDLIKRDQLQDAVLLMLAFDSAGRRNELFQVKKDNLINSNKTNIVIGKRGKTFQLVYLNDTKELIKQYLEQRGEDDIESLWVRGEGDKKSEVTYNTLYERIVKMSDILSELEGKDIEFFPHSLRHSRCECLLQGLDPRLKDKDGKVRKYTLEDVAVFMHHSSTDVTKSYSKDHSEDVIDDMFNF
jgi:site-specific recombinase XerD